MRRSRIILFSRRDFLKQGSALAAGAGLGLMASPFARAQDSEGAYVIGETAFGKIRGVVKSGVNVFKGIPYGADTSGKNRFKPAVDPNAWTGLRDALEYGAATPQSDPATGRQQDGHESEDCLVLNVWTRGLKDGGKRPVMFWIHGGGFRTLSGSSPGYDGTNLCHRGDVVVVTINHRLNVLGFTHFGDLGGEEFAESGNVGMLDIVHALKWVKNNIEEFGGDPDRVLIFGESGGGRKVSCLLAMPDAKGLFHRAVIESGATIKVSERDEATELAGRLLDELGIARNEVRRIQDIPADRILSAYHALGGGRGFQPVRDGAVMPEHPYYPRAATANADVPVIVGGNRTEMTYFAPEPDFSMDAAAMKRRVGAIVGEDRAEDVIDVYRQANPDALPPELYFLIFSDSRYVMPSIVIAERRSALGRAPVHLYYFRWESPIEGGRRMTPHALEIPFAFDNTRTNRFTQGSETAIALADKVSDTWIAFARTGVPDCGKLPKWTPYDAANRATMVIDNESGLLSDPIRAQREIMQPILDL